MPELPDVQVFKEYVDATSLHQRIRTAHLSPDGLLQDVSGSTLRRRLDGVRGYPPGRVWGVREWPRAR